LSSRRSLLKGFLALGAGAALIPKPAQEHPLKGKVPEDLPAPNPGEVSRAQAAMRMLDRKLISLEDARGMVLTPDVRVDYWRPGQLLHLRSVPVQLRSGDTLRLDYHITV
jgi:hypothetical protein